MLHGFVFVALLHISVLYSLPRPKMVQTDLSRLINSDEIQKVLKPAM